MNRISKYADLITIEMYEAMSKDEDSKVRVFVAEHTKSSTILAKLTSDNSNAVIVAVAKNPNTPEDCLKRLSMAHVLEVQEAVALNIKSPIEVLIYLATNGCICAKRNVAMNPNTSEEILVALSKENDKRILKAVSQNPKTPKNALVHIIATLTQ